MKKWIATFTISILFVNIYGQSLDLRLLKQINGPVSGADNTWRDISNSAYISISTIPVGMLLTGIITNDEQLETKSLRTCETILVSQVITFGLKQSVRRKRPYLEYPDLITGKSASTGYSFPSGHTSATFAMAASLSLSFPKWYIIAPSFAYAGTVGYSRMYLGVHYPSDVLAGAIIGAGSSYITWKLQRLLNRKASSTRFVR
jgi:membrane-associated phospholipid phosphatase